MDYIAKSSRSQIQFLSIDQMVSADSWARIVDLFVDCIPFDKIDFKHSKLNKEGRPPFDPSDMMKLFLYCYKFGIRSSYKIHHQSKVNIEIIWLLGKLCPSPRKIQYFRKHNHKGIKQVFSFFGQLLKDWDLLGGETIAVDSFKIRAQNSLKNNFNKKKIDRHIDYIDAKIEDYLESMEDQDSEDEKSKIVEKIAYQGGKKQRYQELEKQIEETGQEQISTTDPDARSVLLHRNIVNVGYNVQAVSDGKYKLLIHADTGNVNDTHDLAPMAIEAKAILGVEKVKILADKGYHTAAQLKECDENNIGTYVSPKQSSSTKKNPDFAVTAFKYNKETDSYDCPAGQQMITNGKYYKKGNVSYRIKQYKSKNCKTCPLKELCTTSPRGRVIERSEYQEYVTRNNERVNANPDYYRQRQQIIEHQFGTFKRQMHFDHTLMRGKENVLTEVRMIMICYNLRRLMSIFSLNELKSKLKAAFWPISAFRTIIRALGIKKLFVWYKTPQWIPGKNSYFGVWGMR